MSALQHPRMTEQEYLAFDQDQPLRHEFYNGEVVAMAGASEAHAREVVLPLGEVWAGLEEIAVGPV